jgi:pimeloyl-ACP methyl ester carboxylesterase/heme-degrading monooxygenase HmoA
MHKTLYKLKFALLFAVIMIGVTAIAQVERKYKSKSYGLITPSHRLYKAPSFDDSVANAQNAKKGQPYEVIKLNSRIAGLHLAMLHEAASTQTGNNPVLFVHGSSFPSALASGFRMGGFSWMDDIAQHNYDCYALDFLGYGYSDRYPEMTTQKLQGQVPGRAKDIYEDIDSAVNCILKRTGSRKISIIAHSWGATVAALYASKFPEKIDKLILFSPLTPGKSTAKSDTIDYSYIAMTPRVRVDAMRRLIPEGETNRLEPEISNQWQSQWLNSDSIASADHKGVVRFPSGSVKDIDDLIHGKAYYSPSLIKVPVLIIRGEWDKTPSNQDAETLFKQLRHTPLKRYVVIEKGTHVMHLEKSRTQLYNEVLNFLNESTMPQNSHSIAVIFEVIPAEGKKQEYLDIAAKLKPELEKIDGFISIERFQSLTHPEKILSLSFWRDEGAIKKWRNLELHRDAQAKGREYIFKDYHLRIADVVRDYGMFDRNEAPTDSRSFHPAKKSPKGND